MDKLDKKIQETDFSHSDKQEISNPPESSFWEDRTVSSTVVSSLSKAYISMLLYKYIHCHSLTLSEHIILRNAVNNLEDY